MNTMKRADPAKVDEILRFLTSVIIATCASILCFFCSAWPVHAASPLLFTRSPEFFPISGLFNTIRDIDFSAGDSPFKIKPDDSFLQFIGSPYLPPVEMKVRTPKSSLKKEMLSWNDFDYGKFKSFVGRNQQNREQINGFLYIPTVWGEQLRPSNEIRRSALGLVEAMNRYTGIETKTGHHLFLSSRDIFQFPFLSIAMDTAFELTKTERENLGEYLRNGGFAFVDNPSPEFEISQAEASLRRMFHDALGAHARFEPIPIGHPLYHCFFDFRDGPPQGGEMTMIYTETLSLCGYTAIAMTMPKPVPFLEGVFLNGRLAAVYSDKGYSRKWSSLNFTENQPQLKMGVNAVVYALTQEGGMTWEVMENFRDIP
jgi:hypothetical protein